MTIAPPAVRAAVSLRCDTSAAWETEAELLIQLLAGEGNALPGWLADLAPAVARLAESESLVVHRTSAANFRAQAVLIVRAGTDAPGALRRAGREIGAEYRSLTRFACAGWGTDQVAARAFAVGLAEGRYRLTRYRRGIQDEPAELVFIETDPRRTEELGAALEAAEIVEQAVRLARDLTNTPARDLTPDLLARAAVREGRQSGAEVRVFDEEWLNAERFAGLCSVGAGSTNPPRLVEVSYRGAAADDVAPLVLVGKGVTFDSGGLSLKKASAMEEMKSDMAGAATALATVCALARLNPPRVHVVALLALAENLPGPAALRPGDIIRHRNELTTEVVNTDCEGRLVLSDVLSWAVERKPSAIVDIATLTYSTIAALGLEITSVIGNDPALIAGIRAAGEATGEPYWELPLWQPYRRLIDSPFADLRNEETGGGAGTITAALYLREFVDSVPWAHLDTGGTAYLDEETEGLGTGATGNGVRSLVQLALARPEPDDGRHGGVS